MVNKHGLDRSSLNAATKRKIRQNSGFGCIFCGLAIGEYDHVDPEFSEAQSHDADRMTFLCGHHHNKVTRGQLSRESVKFQMKRPIALSKGFSHDAFDIGTTPPTIHFGPLSIKGCLYILRVCGRPIFWISTPENEGEPFLINAEISNAAGDVVMRIIENEWQVRTSNWDVEVKGSRITIRNGPRQIALIIRIEPPKELHIERMDMQTSVGKVVCDEENFKLICPDGREVLNTHNTHIMSSESAIDIDTSGIKIGVNGGVMIFSGTIGNSGPQVSIPPLSKRKVPIRRTKTPRNSLCPCGSKMKYKRCCGR